MELGQALAIVRAAGYRVTKVRERASVVGALNAFGKPRSANYDPKWRRRTPLTSIARLSAPRTTGAMGISAERWTELCKAAAKDWNRRNPHDPIDVETAGMPLSQRKAILGQKALEEFDRAMLASDGKPMRQREAKVEIPF